MSVRSAEVANKQHLEGVKKIAKLEAECQRLRGLVRKKLPGPAALAQMKLEVENLGRDYGESRVRRSPVKPSTPHFSQVPEFSLDNAQKYLKENELLTERLLAMEEETKMLKEALAKRNIELQASRSTCAQTASKLQSLEAQLQANGEQRTPMRSNTQVPTEGISCQKASNPSSFTSVSEDENDDNISCAGSWATGLMSELSHFKKEKNVDSPHKSDSANHLDLMDDFLEMEKLAYLSNGSNGTASRAEFSGNTGNTGSEFVKSEASAEVTMSTDPQSGEQHGLEPQVSPQEDVTDPQLQADPLIFVKLQSKISMVLERMSNEKDKENVIEDIRCVMQDIEDTLRRQSVNGVFEADHSSGTVSHPSNLAEATKITVPKEISSGDGNSSFSTVGTINQELQIAIFQIYDFIMILGKEAKTVLQQLLMEMDISHVLSKASELHFNVLGFKSSEVETGSFDCIDKIALAENKAVVDSLGEGYPNGCGRFSDSASDADVPNDGSLVPISESTAPSWKCSLEEFEQLKMDKDNLAVDLARCTENFESTKSQLLETEQLLAEVKSQLTSAQKSNSLAETQLKCMAESYKSLETRAEELQSEVNLLEGKLESLGTSFRRKEEVTRRHLPDARIFKSTWKVYWHRVCWNSFSFCVSTSLSRIENAAADDDDKTSQEKELAAAAEKLAECQETIFLLGKQLKAMRPQTDIISSPNNGRTQKLEAYVEDEPTISGMNLHDMDPSESHSATSFHLHRAGSESPLDVFNAQFSPSDSEANNLLRSPVSSKYPKHRPTKSGSSSASSTPTPEKHTRGFSRFFSSKGKNGQ
ncbi:UNVERIFIED_CONTAM: Filament-like plant protein 4 [Sesamum angustifolium]|uniref:Filament-like plant protein 4 n=1 Tax=Sesamum angustifolium TaxID=2727405 RepID=A0AAW2L8V7_9LAMI